jgi:hypothetical protein
MKVSRLVGCVAFLTVLLAGVITTATAPAGRYTISNGTVYDTKTGLTWQQSANTSGMLQGDAVSYCSNLTGSWRLPSLKELATIVDYSTGNPSIDSNAFPSTPASYFWSSTFVSNGSNNYAWAIAFDYGGWAGINATTTSESVRCVH